jgi:hypothetical protein
MAFPFSLSWRLWPFVLCLSISLLGTVKAPFSVLALCRMSGPRLNWGTRELAGFCIAGKLLE